MNMTPAALKQRQDNVKAIAARKRAQVECKRGHNNWYIRKNGKRICRTCANDRAYYEYRGLRYL